MKLTRVSAIGVSVLFSLSAWATNPTPTLTKEGDQQAAGNTCEKCTKTDKKNCECKGKCACDHKGEKHAEHMGHEGHEGHEATSTETKTEVKK